jgi:superfamily I DNA and/or RNA helicase
MWLQNINRLNVASTRARRALVLIGHAETLRHLRGVPAAAEYYDNLFELLRTGKGGTLLNELEV